jgi:trehalose 6-phosphate phosphatase
VSHAAVTDNKAGWALFLDVDGTLLDIAQTPQEVRVSEDLKRLLCEVCAKLDGALALVSGRGLADLDTLFSPHKFCAAGLHGFERRDAFGCLHRPPLEAVELDGARARLRRFVETRAGLLLEDKGHALAIHFRRAPHLAAEVANEVWSALVHLYPAFKMQRGKCVFEIQPQMYDKGTAVAQLMREKPFLGRTPVFVGDDLADENGFAVVNSMAGVSVRVAGSGATLAVNEFGAVRDVLEWLRGMPGSMAMLRPAETRRCAAQRQERNDGVGP